MKHIVSAISEFKSKNRSLLTQSSIFFIMGTALGLLLSRKILSLILGKLPFKLMYIQTSIGDAASISLLIALFVGLIVTIPFFISEYLKKQNLSKKFSIDTFKLSITFSVLGITAILFSYFVLIPALSFFLIGFNAGNAAISISLEKYISYYIKLVALTVLFFELLTLAFLPKDALLALQDFLKVNKFKVIGGLLFFMMSLNFLPLLFGLVVMGGILILLYKLIFVMIDFLSK